MKLDETLVTHFFDARNGKQVIMDASKARGGVHEQKLYQIRIRHPPDICQTLNQTLAGFMLDPHQSLTRPVPDLHKSRARA